MTEGFEDIAAYALGLCRKEGAAHSRVTMNKSLMEMYTTLNGKLDKVSRCLDCSLSLTLFVDGRFGTFSTNRLDKAELENFVGNAVKMVRILAPDPCRQLPARERICTNARTGYELGLYDDTFETRSSGERMDKALQASIFQKEESAGGNEGRKLVSEEGEYSETLYDTLLVDSEGCFCRHIETSFDYGVEVTIEDASGNKISGYWWDSNPFISALDERSCPGTALKRAVAQIGPQRIPGGKYNIVVESNCASRLVTPLLNALNGYSLQQKNSFLDGTLSKQVFPEGLTITDECTVPGMSGSRLFDSEGVRCDNCAIIEKGVVRRYFLNTFTANKMQMAPTSEDACRPLLHPYSVNGVPSGRFSAEQMLPLLGDGILVTGFNGGNCNSSTGYFSYGIEGFLFKDGKIVHPVRELLITGDFLTLWGHLAAAGNDSRANMSKLIPTLAFSEVDVSA